MIDLADRTVVCNDSEALVVHVEDEILALFALCSAHTAISKEANDFLAMTARPMRPISPLYMRSTLIKDCSRTYTVKRHTLETT